MKRTFLLCIFLGSLFLVATQLQFSSSASTYTDNSFRSIILSQVENYQTEVARLANLAKDYQEERVALKKLQAQLSKTRNAYKATEAIFTYFYPEHVKAYINGPPFEHPEPYPVSETLKKQDYYVVSPEEYKEGLPLDELNTDHYRGKNRIASPTGLQILDELIFSETEAPRQRKRLVSLTEDLEVLSKTLQNALTKRQFFNDFEVMDASRLELVRVFTQGTTGFDTPGSLNIFQEIPSALNGIQELLQPLLKKASSKQQQELHRLFSEAIASVEKEHNFNTFDRLRFLTRYINPLYKELLQVQLDLQVKTTAEVNTHIPAWNAYSENIFAENFLNPYYYSLLKPEDDTPEMRAFGKKLFEDKRLSNSGTMSCVSCHNPSKGFTDGQPTSFSNTKKQRVLRNAPTLINAVYADRFFYDMRAFDLKDQVAHVIENKQEYNTTYEGVLRKINADSSYKKTFRAIRPERKEITRYDFATALTVYVASLRSQKSPFDKYIQGKSAKIPATIKRGFNLFMGKANCATCHFPPAFSGLVPPLFTENESEVLGIMTQPDSLQLDTDPGRIANGVTDDKARIYKRAFKTVSVRNSGVTAPYFHHGAYSTLEEVIDFYDKGGAKGMGFTYQVSNQTLPSDSLHLSKREKKDLIAFLNSLTDTLR